MWGPYGQAGSDHVWNEFFSKIDTCIDADTRKNGNTVTQHKNFVPSSHLKCDRFLPHIHTGVYILASQKIVNSK